jgi:hypothetical protein
MRAFTIVRHDLRATPTAAGHARARGRMRRVVKRRVVKLAAAASLVLCIATVALWVRSYWRLDDVSYRFDRKRCRVQSLRGEVDVSVHRFYKVPESLPVRQGVSHSSSDTANRQYRTLLDLPDWEPTSDAYSGGSFLGFGYVSGSSSSGLTRGIGVPHWSLALLFAILPVLRVRGATRSRRHHRAGRCPTCGYDLRATPDRCPECGAVPAAMAAR